MDKRHPLTLPSSRNSTLEFYHLQNSLCKIFAKSLLVVLEQLWKLWLLSENLSIEYFDVVFPPEKLYLSDVEKLIGETESIQQKRQQHMEQFCMEYPGVANYSRSYPTSIKMFVNYGAYECGIAKTGQFCFYNH